MAKENKGFSIDSFIAGNEKSKDMKVTPGTSMVVVSETVPMPKKSKKEKSAPVVIDPSGPINSMTYIQNNVPYGSMYDETNRQLDEAISELNMLGAETIAELQQIRASKTLRNKYNYITDMTATISNIISSKIGAIKEKNKTINDAAHLELARMKEMKNKANEEDDNARIASMYDAFVNTPIGGGIASIAPPVQDMMMRNQPSVMPMYDIGGQSPDQQTGAWEASLDPASRRMLLEAKGAIDTVVMYDELTGNRWFEVIDKATGQPMTGVEKPSEAYIYDLDINTRGGFAKDSNLNITYPLIIVNGNPSAMSEY